MMLKRQVQAALDEQRRKTSKAQQTSQVFLDKLVALTVERDDLAADLLATRRALKLAQAKAIDRLAGAFIIKAQRERVIRLRARSFRASRLCCHYAAKFEREAGEVK
jgi:hypothetical protein